YGSEYPCNVRDCQYSEYISDNKSNDAVLDSALAERGIKLVIAPPGSGKSTAILTRANELVTKNKDYRVIFDLPTRALTLQMGNNRAVKVKTMMGGDSFDEKEHLIATTYEKMYEVENHIISQKIQGTTEKNVLVLDESHLLTTQHTFRQDAIKTLIRCIEENNFHSIVLVTATPEPLSLFHCDEVLDFHSSNRKSSIDRLEIIEVDDPVEYVKGLDYSKEFPFIRLNNTKEIDKLIAQMPQTMARVTKDDRETKAYKDIVEHGRIDNAGINGILATSVVEAGVSITDYPENIVPIAVFSDNNISTDDIEQFLNRIRVKGNRRLNCARVIVKKPKPREIKASLLPYEGSEECICEFQDVSIKNGDLTINDTDLLDAVGEGRYKVQFDIGNNVFLKYITVASNGTTSEKVYSKNDKVPLVFKGIGFRKFFDILQYNYGQQEKASDSLKILKQILEKEIQGLNLSDDELEKKKLENELLIKCIANGFIKETGEIGKFLSFSDGGISIDKRICFEKSYAQYMRQYYHNHDLLAEEMKFRLGTDVVLMEQDTAKGKKAPLNKEDIWDGIEDLRQEIENIKDDKFWSYLMGKNEAYFYIYSKKKTVSKVREQEHIMELLKGLEKEGIQGKTALRIIYSSRNQRKINEYIKCFHLISYNKLLERCASVDIEDILKSIGRAKEIELQVVIYNYLEQKGVQSPKITPQLEGDILEYYKQSFPNIVKFPTKKKVGNKITQMYKSRGKGRIDKELRTSEDDIFNLVTPDYK
ncbi:MAG: DEAD/DEAH box helicase, partial [Ruminococcus flavefaciens]|nr:DEAD/DEAH box helicase [Ruminococcus flavefaciens]